MGEISRDNNKKIYVSIEILVDRYQELAASGNAHALNVLKEMAEDGEGSDAAQLALGKLYEEGLGVTKNNEEACEWYLRAIRNDNEEALLRLENMALKGLADAQFYLGYVYDQGYLVEEDPLKAVKWYNEAVKQNHVEAMVNLGECYGNGSGVGIDYKKAVELYTTAAMQGSTDALCNIKKLAQDNFSEAQFSLGRLYEGSKVVKQDYKKAYEYYKKAAEQENAAAKLSVKRMEVQSQKNTIEENKEKFGIWKPDGEESKKRKKDDNDQDSKSKFRKMDV